MINILLLCVVLFVFVFVILFAFYSILNFESIVSLFILVICFVFLLCSVFYISYVGDDLGNFIEYKKRYYELLDNPYAEYNLEDINSVNKWLWNAKNDREKKGFFSIYGKGILDLEYIQK